MLWRKEQTKEKHNTKQTWYSQPTHYPSAFPTLSSTHGSVKTATLKSSSTDPPPPPHPPPHPLPPHPPPHPPPPPQMASSPHSTPPSASSSLSSPPTPSPSSPTTTSPPLRRRGRPRSSATTSPTRSRCLVLRPSWGSRRMSSAMLATMLGCWSSSSLVLCKFWRIGFCFLLRLVWVSELKIESWVSFQNLVLAKAL